MKLVFAVASLLAGPALHAQEFQPDLQKIIDNSRLSRLKQDTLGQIPNAFGYHLPSLEPKVVKPAPGIYSLPQDGMPCIVPDTQNIAAMPNATRREVTPPANRIPNGVKGKRGLQNSIQPSK
jgi:hypothetical protein